MNAPSDDTMEALFRATCPGDKCFSPKCVTSNPNCRTEHRFVSRLTAAGFAIISAADLTALVLAGRNVVTTDRAALEELRKLGATDLAETSVLTDALETAVAPFSHIQEPSL